MDELMDLDMGLGHKTLQFLEASMVEGELAIFVDIMTDGACGLIEAFMETLNIYVPEDVIQLDDVVH